MRRPTDITTLYAWHMAALAGEEPAITEDPQCGWYARRLVKGGPLVPARIWLEQDVNEATGELHSDEMLRCDVAGRAEDPFEAWTWLARHPISEGDFNYLTEDSYWAAWHAPDDPVANPRQPIDFLTAPIPEF